MKPNPRSGLIQRCATSWVAVHPCSRSAGNLTDKEWARIQALLPVPHRQAGNRNKDTRAIVNAIIYILTTGCSWNEIPNSMPPRTTLYDYLDAWSRSGFLTRIHNALCIDVQPEVQTKKQSRMSLDG